MKPVEVTIITRSRESGVGVRGRGEVVIGGGGWVLLVVNIIDMVVEAQAPSEPRPVSVFGRIPSITTVHFK